MFRVLLASIIGLYALFLGCGGLLAYHLKAFSNRLDHIEAKYDEKLGRLNDSSKVLTTLKDSLTDIVEETLENLNPPTAFDHLAGAAVQFMQMKMMSGLEQVSPQLADLAESVIEDNV